MPLFRCRTVSKPQLAMLSATAFEVLFSIEVELRYPLEFKP